VRKLRKDLELCIATGYVDAFYDDIVIFTPDEKTHIEILELVFCTLENCGWKINASKCEFLQSEIEVLGHLVRPKEVLPRPCYEVTMAAWDEPHNKKELQSFLGFAGYHSRF